MIPRLTSSAQVGKELPEAIRGMFESQILKRLNHLRIILLTAIIVL